MNFDWITWSIWSLGVVILIVWIYVPIKEFRQLLKERQAKSDSPAQTRE